MSDRQSFNAALLFGGAYLGVMLLLAFVAGTSVGVWALWNSLNGGLFRSLVGAVSLVFGGPILALFGGVFSLPLALAAAAFFYVLANFIPFTSLGRTWSNIALLACGTLASTCVHVLLPLIFKPSALSGQSAGATILVVSYGLAASIGFLWLEKSFLKDEDAA